MILHKMVAKFKDDTLLKGTTNDFSPDKKEFHLTLTNDDVKTIDMEKLKALFYVQDFEGKKAHAEIYTDEVPEGGRKVIVEFDDGEIIIGYSPVYSPKLQGFFLVPANTKSNNKRIYVVKSATKKISLIERRAGPDRRKMKDPNYNGPERRSGKDRRLGTG